MIIAPALKDVSRDEEFLLSEVFQEFDPLHLLYCQNGYKVWLATENPRLIILQSPDNKFHSREVVYLSDFFMPELLDYEDVCDLSSSSLGQDVISKKDITFSSGHDLTMSHGLTFVDGEFFEDDYISSLETYLLDRTIYCN